MEARSDVVTLRLERLNTQRLAAAARSKCKTRSTLLRDIVVRYLDQIDIEAEVRQKKSA